MAKSRDATVLLADLSGGTLLRAVQGASDDAPADDGAAAVRETVERHTGRVVRTAGDVVIAVLPDVTRACACACALQTVFEARARADDAALQLRVAVSSGAARVSRDGVTGAAVEAGAELIAAARSGEILLSRGVFEGLPAGERAHCRPVGGRMRKRGRSEDGAYELVWREAPTQRVQRVFRPTTARLRLVNGAQTVVVGDERAEVCFGRAASSDLRIDDECASRRHGTIAHRKGKFYLTDTSSNGTLIVGAHGRMVPVQGETVLLEGAGAIRLGRPDGPSLTYGVEVLGSDGVTWQPAVEAPALDERSRQSVLRLEGEYWTIAFEGRVLRMKDAKGLRYIAHLVRHVGEEIHALDLARLATSGTPAGRREGAGGDSVRRDEGGAGPALDPAAKAAYRRRVAELRDDLEEAEAMNDVGRAARAREEMEFITGQLAAAVGLGGRDRPMASDSERARVMVTMRVKAAIRRLRASHPALGHHFATSIKTGRFCSYTPGPANPVTWLL